ncbi:hypothetical protein BCV71DRAFT_265629 [Rhizopus microsporus]|uniref:Uncharacterized protein n=1 Tax=Rhizopus microsporus TaxID=58291 RepID=A0A1X0RWU3_RHIZD|nr:hypothetical protein BCV71DRAFT_265629 [Rhizopus microsporus]
MNMQLLDDRLETIEIVHEELGHDVNHAILISDNDDVNDGTATFYGSKQLKQNVIHRHRNKKMTPWLLLEFIWRRKNRRDLWGAIVTGLGAVSFTPGRFNPAYDTQFEYIDDEQEE